MTKIYSLLLKPRAEPEGMYDANERHRNLQKMITVNWKDAKPPTVTPTTSGCETLRLKHVYITEQMMSLQLPTDALKQRNKSARQYLRWVLLNYLYIVRVDDH